MPAILVQFFWKHLVVIVAIVAISAACLVMYKNWEYRVKQQGQEDALNEVKKKNEEATRAAIRASRDSGRPARVQRNNECLEGYSCAR